MSNVAESLAALLETAPPELREELTQVCRGWPSGNLDCVEARPQRPGLHLTKRECPCKGTGRVPLPIAEAHVALERFWTHEPIGGVIEIVSGGTSVHFMKGRNWIPGHGADIFEAVAAALKEGKR